MKQISFKAKVITLVITIISVTVLTSFLSANAYISEYISKSDTRNIQTQLNLVKDKLVSDINNDVKLAKSSNFSIMEIKETIQSTGFKDIIKFSYDLVFDQNGGIDDPVVVAKYIDQIKQASGQVVISDIYFENDNPLITITIARSNDNGEIFVIDLSAIRNLLQTSSVEGSYVELVQHGPFSDPVYLNINGTYLAIRRDMAAQIQVERL